MGRPVPGGASALNAAPLPYTIYDRMRDRIIHRRIEGCLNAAEYQADMRKIDERERREAERAKSKARVRT